MIQSTILTALTRSPGPELARCGLTHLSRQPIDIERAAAQHRAYQGALRAAGVEVIGCRCSDPRVYAAMAGVLVSRGA